VILSGGLNPDNVKEAIGATAPFAVDVGTGVEERPGKKNVDQMRRLMKTLAF
jgi:phosphoribosylanthranilate isomerase